jgi:protein-S-isoprenylcysteine O-methyltransferase Ste14
MKPIVLLFLVVYAIARFLETFWRRTKLPGEILARYSLPLIVVAYVSFYLLICWEWSILGDAEFRSQRVTAGIISVVLSGLGRYWAIKTLGIYHSIHVEVRHRHELIELGPYRHVRNPYYLCNIIEALGLAGLVNFRPAVLMGLLVYLALLLHRLAVEEKALENKFRQSFLDYKSRVPMIIPRLHRVRKVRGLSRSVLINHVIWEIKDSLFTLKTRRMLISKK